MMTRTDVSEELANNADAFLDSIDDVVEYILSYVRQIFDETNDGVEIILEFFDDLLTNKLSSTFHVACEDITDEGARCNAIIFQAGQCVRRDRVEESGTVAGAFDAANDVAMRMSARWLVNARG